MGGNDLYMGHRGSILYLSLHGLIVPTSGREQKNCDGNGDAYIRTPGIYSMEIGGESVEMRGDSFTMWFKMRSDWKWK